MINTITRKGVELDKDIIEAAEASIAGAGDGRISLDDAHKLLSLVKDGDKYTELEKTTMSYIRENYNWTEQADEWFRTKIRSWAASN